MSSKYTSKSSSKESLDLNWVLKYLKDGVYPSGLNFSEKRMIRKRAERFCYLKGDLYYLGTAKDQELGKKSRKVLLTHDERIKKVHECHIDAEGTHLGLEKTAEGFISEFHWVGIYRFVKDYIHQCSVCLERHPKMLQSGNSFFGYGDLADEDSSTAGDDSSFCESETSVLAGSSSVDTMVTEEDFEMTAESARMFWEKVDLRLYGPYKWGSSSKHILVALDGYSLWPEAFVLDTVSPATVAQSLLQMICRYGEMCNLVISCEDEVLEASLGPALTVLKREADIHIPLKKCKLSSTENAFQSIEDSLNKFTKKHLKTWVDCIDYCLLPHRISRSQDAEYTPSFLAHSREPVLPDRLSHNSSGSADIQLSVKEKSDTTDIMMSTHLALQNTVAARPAVSRVKKSELFATPQPSPVKDGDKQAHAHVTRSRTGNAKPKAVNEEEFETLLPKRKMPSTPNPTVQVKKKVRVEPVMSSTPRVDRAEEGNSDSETDVADDTSKKAVDLDTYYSAIKQFISPGGYPEKSSNSFKRLIRDQAKHYSLQDGHLYHEVGVKGTLKKIIMTKEERAQLLRDTYLKHPVKTQMVPMLDSVHWKGKLLDCEAFLMAMHSDKQEPKSTRDSLRHLAEAKKQLQYDTRETYKEIKNFIIYDVFSDDDATKRLDYLKRQLKNFRVENDELYNVMGNKKRPVVTEATRRQHIINSVYQKKGASADLTSVFNQVSEMAFWFAMKLDVKVFLTSADSKHLLDRYFLFREHFMNEPMPESSDADEEAADGEEMETEVSSTAETSPSGPVPVFLTRAVPPKPPGIFISSVKGAPSVATESTQAGVTVIHQSISNAGDATSTPSQTIIPDQPLVVDAEAGTEGGDKNDSLRTVYVRLTESGETVVMDSLPKKPAADVTVNSTQGKSSDEVTLAAVKTILQEQVSGQSSGEFTPVETIVTSNTVEVPMSAPPILTAPDGTDTGGQLSISLGESETVITTESGEADTREDGESQTNEDEMEDSDDGLYDSDEDDDDEIYDDDDNKSDASGLTDSNLSVITVDGVKKVATPRQHFKCSQCDKLFYGPLKFKMHMYKHTGQKPFPCNLCNKKYTNKKSLVIHQRTHTGELPYLCNLCGKRCPSKIALKSHLKCHDGKGGGFPAKCDVCQRVFSRRHLMERHKLHKHTNAQSEYKCTECNKVFGHQRSLKRHFMSTHMGVKNHVCGMCGKAFCRKEYLTGHLIQHGAAEGFIRKQRPSTSKPRPSVFNHQFIVKKKDGSEDEEVEEKLSDDQQVQRIILTQDENGQLRVMDMAMEKEVRRILDGNIAKNESGETMVVHIEEPSTGEPQVVHVEQTEEQVVEVPIEEQGYVEYQQIDPDKPQEYVISAPATAAASTSNTQYIYTSSQGDFAVQGNQELIYGQPAVQYEVECVGDVGDEEALSAINLLAQASAQQYETVISQI